MAALPGIGLSTAGAILAFAFGARQPILDGNVKRVLARHAAVATPLEQRQTIEKLWRLARTRLPRRRMADYTQAIMDLGAMVCTRTQPRCESCPVSADCRARRSGRPEAYPVRARGSRGLPVRRVQMLLIRDARGQVLLTQQPPTGRWGGLWTLPECPSGEDVVRFCLERWGLEIVPQAPWPVRRHDFTHFRLEITPIPACLRGESLFLMESSALLWYNLERPERIGLPTPVQRLLDELKRSRSAYGAYGEMCQARA
jgi:A/G-specific adenine glycosylase